MPTATLTQTIAAPVDDVFSVVTDLRTFPDWNPTITRARKLSDGPIDEGTRFEMTINGFGKQELVLREFEQNRRVNLVPMSAMFRGGHRFTLTASGNRTQIDHELVMDPKHIFKLMAPLMARMSRKNLADTAAALQRHLEDRVQSPDLG